MRSRRSGTTTIERSSARAESAPAGQRAGIDPSFLAALERSLGHAPVAFAVTDGPTHTLRYANAPFRRLQSAGEIAIAREVSSDERVAVLAPLLDRAFRRGALVHDRMIGPTARWSCTAWPIATGPGAPEGLVVEVRDAAYIQRIRAGQRAIAERLLLGALREQDAASEARATGERSAYLASLGRDLAVSLDTTATRNVVRHVRLPRPGTWCIVDLVEPNGMVHRLAVIHPDPAKHVLARSLSDRWYEMQWEGPIYLAQTRPAGFQPQVFTKDAGDQLVAVAHGERELEMLRQLGFEALLVVPMILGKRVLGALTFVTPEGGPPITPEEVAVASDLADRCAMALDHSRLYHEAEVLREAAEAANRAKSDFLARMSHELRTPLAAIGGFVELLALEAAGPLTEQQRTDLGRIKHHQVHLAALITQILTYASAEGGRIEYHWTTVPMQQILTDVAGMMEEAARERGIVLKLRPAQAEWVAWADLDRVRQILLNVISNAVKFSPGGSAIILESSATADAVMIHVTDAGPGIPSDKTEEIFEPFVQLHTGWHDRKAGVGLGLAISRDLARAMRGDLSVQSTLGVGSRFTLTLPRPRPGATS